MPVLCLKALLEIVRLFELSVCIFGEQSAVERFVILAELKTGLRLDTDGTQRIVIILFRAFTV